MIACAVILSGTAHGQQTIPPGQTCIYASHAYSEGADVCVARALMQTCISDGDRLIWKTVTDASLGRLCAGAIARPHWTSSRLHHISHASRPVAPAATKCFQFNGRTYCE